MYGSDKVLLDFLEYAAPSIDPVVVIESEGQFADLARAIPCEVIVRNLGVLRQKHMAPSGIVYCAFHTLSAAIWLARYIRSQHISLVFTNTVSVLAGALAAKLSARPHLWLVHEILEGKARLLSGLVRPLSDRIVAVSPSSAQSVHRAMAKTEIAYPGVRVREFDEAPAAPLRKIYSLPEATVLIGMVGRIHHWKGQDYFLDALYQLKQRGVTNFRGLIIGEVYSGYEPLKQELKSKVKRLSLETEVVFCGHHDQIESIFKGLDIVVAPSTRPDPFCLVVAEAMAAGRPVIATDWGGPKEIIENGVSGGLIPPDAPVVFADRLATFIRDLELCRTIGQAARKRIEAQFSRGAFNRQVLEAVRTLLSSS